MQKGMGTAIGVWVAAIIAAVVVVHQVEHPMRWTERAPVISRAIAVDETNGTPEGDVPRADVEDVEGYVMVLPTVTIVSAAHGVAEMQGGGGVVVGPGVVTHPATPVPETPTPAR